MSTIQEKFQFYTDQIKMREQEFVDSLNLSIQPEYFGVSPNGLIEEIKITGVKYWSEIPYFDSAKRKTRKDLEQLVYFYNNPPELKEDRVIVYYEHQEATYKVSGGYKLKDILLLHPTREAAEIVSEAKKNKIRQEEILLQNGHFRCQRCRKVTKNEDKVTANIINRAWNNIRQKQYVKSELMEFCSGNCAGCEQMSREG